MARMRRFRSAYGYEFDTGGNTLKAVQKYDEWFVVGMGMIIPVDSEEEAYEEVRKWEERKRK